MKNINFRKLNGLIPVVIQSEKTRDVLMVGFMNKEAFIKTCNERIVYFWSRTKNRLWKKGEESGNILIVRSITTDCDRDTLLISVAETGVVCHTGKKLCFFENI